MPARCVNRDSILEQLKSYLEQALGHRVDLVTERGLKPLARASVEQDLIRVP